MPVVNLKARVTVCDEPLLNVTLDWSQLSPRPFELYKEVPTIGEEADTVRRPGEGVKLVKTRAVLLGIGDASPLKRRLRIRKGHLCS